MARETRALPGGGSGLGPMEEIRARRPAGLVGTVSHRPLPGLPGEVGTARGTRALPGGGSGLGPVVEIRAKRPAGSGRDAVSPSVPLQPVGTVSHRPSPWAAGRGWNGPRDSGPTGGAAARMGRWSRFGPRGPLVPVGTVSHRPSPGLPGEVGMARETRALPGGSGLRPGSGDLSTSDHRSPNRPSTREIF